MRRNPRSAKVRSGWVWLSDEAAEEEVGERRVSGNSGLGMELAWGADFRVKMVVRPE
jgi:hypothetical protein